MFWSLFIFREHSTREPASGRVTCFILRAYTGIGRVEIRKKSLAVSVACMAIY